MYLHKNPRPNNKYYIYSIIIICHYYAFITKTERIAIVLCDIIHSDK
jgi:hypothetical protein